MHLAKRPFDVLECLDPLSPLFTVAQGLSARFSGEWEAAASVFRSALDTFADFAFVRFQFALVESALGHTHEAIDHFERSMPRMGLALVGVSLAYEYVRAERRTKPARSKCKCTTLRPAVTWPPARLHCSHWGSAARRSATNGWSVVSSSTMTCS